MAALLHDPAPVDDDQPVEGGDGREPVGDGDARSCRASGSRGTPGSPPRPPSRGPRWPRRGPGWERPSGSRARWRSAGAGRRRASRPRSPTWASKPRRPRWSWSCGMNSCGMGELRGLRRSRGPRRRAAIGDVVADRAVQERGVLGHHGDRAGAGESWATPWRCPARRSGSVRPRGRSRRRSSEVMRSLAGAARAHEPDLLAGPDGEVQVDR